MTQRRCLLPDPQEPGSLQLVTMALASHCASFQLRCLEGALRKWLSLYTIKILGYVFCSSGVVMLVYLPNRRLSRAEARKRTEAFDEDLRRTHTGLWNPRGHRYSPEKLNSLSDFMHDFSRDFIYRHKKQPCPKNLCEGTYPLPRLAGPYKVKTVQHDALPPVFSFPQFYGIRLKLKVLGFSGEAKVRDVRQLYVSSHGIGTKYFLECLEARCVNYLYERRGKRAPELRCPSKRIVPYCPEVWCRRALELASEELYGCHPKMWGLIQNISMLKDELLTVECFKNDPWVSKNLPELELVVCLPFTLTLMLADGLLRWYYRTEKGVVFPEYNYYRRKYPHEYTHDPLEGMAVV